MTEAGAISALENLIDDVLVGKTNASSVDADQFPDSLRPLAEKINKLCADIVQTRAFAESMAAGDMDCEPPGRRNYIASTLKELHSQLSSLSWSMRQLSEGKMVSKLQYPGEVYDSFNKVVDIIATSASVAQSNTRDWGDAANSWRYHQTLSALNSLHIMVIEVNRHGEILFANPPTWEVLKYMQALPYNEAREPNEVLLDYLCSFENHLTDVDLAKLLSERSIPVIGEVYDKATRAWYKITSERIKLYDGEIGLLHVIDDISEWKDHEARLRKKADIDALTGAFTRKAGMHKLGELMRQNSLKKNCTAFVDIDGLKEINDNYGHNEGDYSIKTIAQVMLECVRDTDWVVRYGGDEFLMLFPNCTAAAAEAVIVRMNAKLKEINDSNDKDYELSFSYGISEITEDMSSIADVISSADSIMYENKQKKKED